MSIGERPSQQPIKLPTLDTPPFFPSREPNNFLRNELLTRAGKDNLVYALEYGSHVSGDATPTSIHDVMIVVDDANKFHKDNILLHGADYGTPRNAKWHAFLNTFGFNFYQTKFRGEDDQILSAKFAVISKDNFIKGCSGTLTHKGDGREGAFGMYVAGRLQKAALSPVYKREDETTAAIESAINVARIDGVWFTLGLLEDRFSYEDLLQEYVSLSYKADIRVEKNKKAQILIETSRDDYSTMFYPIIDSFMKSDLIRPCGGEFEKTVSLSEKEVKKRLVQLKAIAFATNYLKNPLTAPLGNSLFYALMKVLRAADSYIHPQDKLIQ